jgi:hypothetical protein
MGKSSKTVPFDKLTDCDVSEPAGTAICCCVPNVLTTVTVDTASSGGQLGHELTIVGLRDPHAFKKCVWDCKRGSVNLTGADGIRAVAAAGMGDRGGADLDNAAVPLLREIRDELRAQTELLRTKH